MAHEPIRAVIFDMDGVLTDSEPLINAAAVTMFKELGLEVQPEDFVPFIGTGEDRYIGGVAEKYGFSLDLAAAKKRTYEIYLDLVPQRLRMFPGAQVLFYACKNAGLKVVLASSADRIKIEANLRKIGLPVELWDAVVSGETVPLKKPAPDLFLAASAQAGLPPYGCVVVEDAVNGVQAAKAAGMRCVAVTQTFPAASLQAADLIREKLADISVADLCGQIPAPPLEPRPLGGQTGSGGPGPDNAAKGPWGFWATAGWSVVIAAGFILTQVGVLIAVILVAPWFGAKISMEEMESNGFALGLATCLATPVGVWLCWLCAGRRRGLSPKEYLALRRVAPQSMSRWVVLLLLFVLASDGLTSALGRPIVPDFMVETWRSAGFVPLLLLALLAAAPIGEEIFFRGFIFEGLKSSSLGAIGAIVATSFVWAVIHLQYDLYGIGTIFAVGLLFGYVRLKTNSVYPTILLHAVMNLIATLELIAFEHWI